MGMEHVLLSNSMPPHLGAFRRHCFRTVRFQLNTLTCELVDDCESAECPPTDQRMAHENPCAKRFPQGQLDRMRGAVPQWAPDLWESPMPAPFPTMEQVERANREQIARWHCFLAMPNSPSEQDIADRIADRFLNLGGLTPGLREKIGFPESSGNSRTAHGNAPNLVNLMGARRSLEQIAKKPGVSKRIGYKSARFFKAS